MMKRFVVSNEGFCKTIRTFYDVYCAKNKNFSLYFSEKGII